MAGKHIPNQHPGIMLKEDFIDDLGIKPGTLARKIGVDRSAVKAIVEPYKQKEQI